MATKRIKDLPTGTPAAGDYLAVDPASGSTYKVPLGVANGVALLDSTGRLMHRRRVLDVRVGTGSTGNISFTTSDYILPDPELVFNAPSEATILLWGAVSWSNLSTNHDVYLKFAYSRDGGTTWQTAGPGDAPQHYSAGVSGVATYATRLIVPAGEVRIRLMLRKFGDAQVDLAYNSWRYILGLMVDY